MNEELQKQLADYLASIASAAKAGSQFAIEQAPLVVQEKIAYGRAAETFQLVLFIAAAYIGYRISRWGFAADRDGFSDGGIAAGFVGCASAVIFSIIAAFQVFFVAQVWLAPRLYVIEWATDLLSKVTK